MPLRLWRYMLSIMEQHTKAHPGEPLPIIYPLTFYTGDRPYGKPMDFIELFEMQDRDLARQIMYNPFRLFDINLADEEDFQKYVILNTLMTAMKNYRNIDQYLSKMAKGFLLIEDKAGGTEIICAIINYIVGVGQAESAETFANELREALPEEQRVAMESISQHFVEKGRKEVAINMLTRGLDVDFVAETSGLSRSTIEELAKQRKNKSGDTEH